MTNPKAVYLEYDDMQLIGSHYKAADSKGTVLLNHGFSSNRIGVTRSYVRLARALLEEGFSSIAYDRLGQGESPLELEAVTLSGEVNQIIAMIEAHSHAGPVHLVGHSLGGMATALAASRKHAAVGSVTLWAPAAYVADEITSGRVLGESLIPILGGDVVDHGGQAVGAALVESARNFDPYNGIEAYRGPVHLHHGEDDQVVPIRYSEKYKEIWADQATLRRYPDGDHGFSSLPIRKVLIGDTVEGIVQAAYESS